MTERVNVFDMTLPNPAWHDVDALLKRVLDGHFYDDYDGDLVLLHRAEQGLANLALAIQSDREENDELRRLVGNALQDLTNGRRDGNIDCAMHHLRSALGQGQSDG